MRVLITGGGGFIGSHLADAYLKRGDEVYVIDDLSTGTIENIQHLKGQSRFHYTIDTVFKETHLPRRNQKKTVDLVDLVNGMMEGRNMEREAKGYKKRKGNSDSGGDIIISVSGD